MNIRRKYPVKIVSGKHTIVAIVSRRLKRKFSIFMTKLSSNDLHYIVMNASWKRKIRGSIMTTKEFNLH